MKNTHYYIYNGKRYENMKECREAIGYAGVSSASFKHLVKSGIVTKHYE